MRLLLGGNHFQALVELTDREATEGRERARDQPLPAWARSGNQMPEPGCVPDLSQTRRDDVHQMSTQAVKHYGSTNDEVKQDIAVELM